MDELEITFLEMGKQSPEDVARRLADFLREARETIEFAVYDFNLSGPQRAIVVAALEDRARAGVKIRLVYDSDTDWQQIQPGNSRPPSETVAFIRELGYPARPVRAVCCLMHQKYVLVDAATPEGRVWTGSTNFTDASWSLQENNIVTLLSQRLAEGYAGDFTQLWDNGTMVHGEPGNTARDTLVYKGSNARTQVHFSPGEGRWLDNEIAVRIEAVRERLTICAAVITSGRILGALGDLMERGVPVSGVYDKGQMDGVFNQWQRVPGNKWKIAAFNELVEYGNLVGKVTTPWTPTSVHDFMHNKILVTDDTVITGSYNFSRNAETNAENVLFIKNEAAAADYRAYIARLAARYGTSGR